MKKIALFVSFVAITFLSSAQIFEIGARFGETLGNNVAIDGIMSVGKYSRIHADVSFGNGIGVEALYDFLYKPVPDTPLNWYMGVGPAVLLGDTFVLGGAGEIGLEYRFDFPMVIGLDWRPTLVLVENTDFVVDSFGLNLRYTF